MKSRRRICRPEASDRGIVAVQMRAVKGCPMSALGQKQTHAVQNAMSAIPPKADMCSATLYVRFGPIADIAAEILKKEVANQGDLENALWLLRHTLNGQVGYFAFCRSRLALFNPSTSAGVSFGRSTL